MKNKPKTRAKRLRQREMAASIAALSLDLRRSSLEFSACMMDLKAQWLRLQASKIRAQIKKESH